MQNDKETVTRRYVVDYLSIANRDIFVTEDGSYTTRYVYDASGRRISAEFDYAEGTHRGEAGENLQSDIAVSIGKVFYRTSILGSTLFAVDKDGNQIAHAIYDPWGKPLTETYTDSNYSGLENLNNYTGYTWDITLKLYFAQNRFYDADTHRFTQEDTAKDGANWYVYCGNGPVLRVDVSGNALAPKSILVDDGGHSARQVWQQGDSSYPIEAQLMLMVLSWAYYNVDLQLRDSILSVADDVRAAYNKSGSNKKTPIAKALDAQLSNGSLDKTMLYNIFTKNRITITMGNRNDYSTYVMNISLSNPNLVNVKDDDTGRIYSGGNQGWHDSALVNSMGCGSISLTNIILYYMFKMEGNTNKTIAKSEYLAFYDELTKKYGVLEFEPLPSIYALQAGAFLSALGLTAHIRHASATGGNILEAVSDVTCALLSDNPVALQVLFGTGNVTSWHWVTITAIHVNPFDRYSTKIDFSSWGTLYDGSEGRKNYIFSDAWHLGSSLVYFS